MEWIKCSDRLPPYISFHYPFYVFVIIPAIEPKGFFAGCSEKKEIKFGYWKSVLKYKETKEDQVIFQKKWGFYDKDDMKILDITHWLEVQAPKE